MSQNCGNIFVCLLVCFWSLSFYLLKFLLQGPKTTQEEKGLFLLKAIRSNFITEKSQGRNVRQEVNQKPWRNTAYWPVPHGLLSLLSYAILNHELRIGNIHRELGPPISIIHQENVPRGFLTGHFGGVLFQSWGFPLPFQKIFTNLNMSKKMLLTEGIFFWVYFPNFTELLCSMSETIFLFLKYFPKNGYSFHIWLYLLSPSTFYLSL